MELLSVSADLLQYRKMTVHMSLIAMVRRYTGLPASQNRKVQPFSPALTFSWRDSISK